MNNIWIGKMDHIKKLLLSKDTTSTIESLKELDSDSGILPTNIVKEIHTLWGDTDVGQDVYTDTELLKSYNGSEEGGILFSCDHSILKGSKLFLKELLLNPIKDINILERRQSVIKKVANQDPSKLLKEMAECEPDMLWMLDNAKKTDELSTLYNMVFFNNMLTSQLNRRGEILTGYNLYRIVGSPLIGLLTPIVYFIIPYLVVRIRLKINIGFIDYLKMMFNGMFNAKSTMLSSFPKLSILSTAFSLIFYFQGIFNTIEVSKASYQISSFVVSKMNSVVRYVKLGEDLIKKFWLQDMKSAFFIGEKDYQVHDEFVNVPNARGFTMFSNFGLQLKHYKFFKRERYLNLLRHTYIIDAISSISKLGFCYPTYLSNKDKPLVKVNGLWHPSLTNPVLNNLTLDKNFLITGPNAGGKSTLIKSTLLAILFSQTFGVANCKSISMTPFFYINSQMNIPDCKGKESLFEAEMYRSKANLDKLKDLDQRLSIIFMDEIFNSTNPVEGIAGAYAIAKHMASYSSNLSVITTHYLYLTKLAKELPDKFVNMKMNVNIKNQEISYPYKISPGFSRQYIALELLKKNGFDPDVVEDAIAIKSRLCG